MTGTGAARAAMAEAVVERVHSGHALLLTITVDLGEEQLYRSGGRTAPSIGWHLWHMARWADVMQEALPRATPALARLLGKRPQLWDARDLANAWAFDPATLGHRETGSLMEEESTLRMRFPGREALLDYARAAFAAADEAVAALDGGALDEECQHFYGTRDGVSTVGYGVQFHAVHAYRHLGSVEALRGLLGLVGTATR